MKRLTQCLVGMVMCVLVGTVQADRAETLEEAKAKVAAEMTQIPAASELTKPEKKKLKKLIKRMCMHLMGVRNNGKFDTAGAVLEDYILRFNGWTRDTENYTYKVTAFWNTYNPYFICRNHPEEYKKQHIFKRTIDSNLYREVLEKHLLRDSRLYPIDVNVIEMVNGEPETVLDYIDKILASPDVEDNYDTAQIAKLRDRLIKGFDAKHARDL